MAGARATRIGCAGGMVLLDDRRQRLFAFNRTADAIWRLWDDGLAPDEIAALLADAHGIAPHAAKADVARIVAQLPTSGLIGAHPPPPAPYPPFPLLPHSFSPFLSPAFFFFFPPFPLPLSSFLSYFFSYFFFFFFLF